jgi:hypothetical protein
MTDLLDGIKRLKAQRALAGHTVIQPEHREDTNELSSLIRLYEAICNRRKIIKNLSDLPKNGPEAHEMKRELIKMEGAFRLRWSNFSVHKRRELVNRLLSAGLLPLIVREVLNAFDGQVIKLI